jgi:hypothetical protein
MTSYRDRKEAGEYAPPAEDLDGLSKDELLAEAERRGIEVPSGATKTEIKAAIEAS